MIYVFFIFYMTHLYKRRYSLIRSNEFDGWYKVRLKDKKGTELIVSRRYADQIRCL
jgi:hypothetical protein